MKPQVRARILWAIASLVLVYALVNVIVYFASGSFGPGWFVASLVVYGVALAGAVLLLAAERHERREDGPTTTVQVLNVGGQTTVGTTEAGEAMVIAQPQTLVVTEPERPERPERS